MFKRVVIKLSGEALAGHKADHFDNGVVGDIADQIKTILKKGVQVSIVVGGGNFWRGKYSNESMDRTKSDHIGMLATVMNGIYLSDVLRKMGVKSVVMTPFMVGTMAEQFSRDKAEEYLANKMVVICAGGSGHPFFSTDTITAIRAAELKADAILFAKNGVNGIYDSDPNVNPNAEKYTEITYREIITRNLQVIDISAMAICEEQNIYSIVFGIDEPNGIVFAATGNQDQLYEVATKITV